MKEEIFNTYYNKIYYWSLGKTKNKEDAKDLTNDIFVQIYTYLNKNIEIKKLDSLIWTIVYNTWKNKVRHIYKEKNIIYDEEIISNIKVKNNNIDKLIYQDILDNLESFNLTEKETKVFNLYYKNDLSIKEISDILNMTISNIKYYLYSSRKKIKENYND